MIENRLRQAKDAGLGDPDDHATDAKVPPGESEFVAALGEVGHESRSLREVLSQRSACHGWKQGG